MSHSLSKAYHHLIFHVRSTSVVIHKEHLDLLFHYIGGILQNLGCFPIIVGGMPDHIHILFDLSREQCIANVVKTIKSASHYRLRTLSPYYQNFHWQHGYGIFSVSASVKDNVYNYIAHQEEHHRHKTMQEEYEEMLHTLGISYDARYLWE